MKKSIIFISFLAVVASGCIGKSNKQKKETADPFTEVIKPRYGGIYAFGDSAAEEKARGRAYIYPENDSTLLFYIRSCNGAPAYNSGEIDGRVTVQDGKATFRKDFGSAGKDCVIHFTFHGDTLTIAQENYDCGCGFGHNVYLDDIFLRTTSDIPPYFTTMANDTVYFGQWQEDPEQETGESTFRRIDSRFMDYFPDLVLGREHERGKLLPQEIAGEYLADLLLHPAFEGDVKRQFYAVGKITGYRGMNLYVCDYDGSREDEDDYDNHTDNLRFVMVYGADNFPLSAMAEDGNVYRIMSTMGSHYYGEGGESFLHSYFDTDTLLVSREHISESESATGFETPLVSRKDYRSEITPLGEEMREITRLEFSSPFYDRDYLKQQNWPATERRSPYPTENDRYPLLPFPDGEEDGTTLLFHIERAEDELFPVFEIRDREGKVLDNYTVGKPQNSMQIEASSPGSTLFKCTVIIKTSDGELEMLPGERRLRLKIGKGTGNHQQVINEE